MNAASTALIEAASAATHAREVCKRVEGGARAGVRSGKGRALDIITLRRNAAMAERELREAALTYAVAILADADVSL